MLYGANNPVDGAVLKVILRKAENTERTRRCRSSSHGQHQSGGSCNAGRPLELPRKKEGLSQLSLGLDATERDVERAWQQEKERISRTVFAQRRLRPEEVLPEWKKAVNMLGGEEDVLRFVKSASERLGAALEEKKGTCRIPVAHLPSRCRRVSSLPE